jgi:hypothetical protein
VGKGCVSKRHHYQKPHRLSKLHDELIAADISLESVEGIDEDIWLTVPDSQTKAPIDSVVSAHTDSPPLPPSGHQLIEDLKNALANWDLLTPLQKDAVLRRCARAIVGIAEMIQSRSA